MENVTNPKSESSPTPNAAGTATPRPWAWQEFGDAYFLVSQTRHRPIVLSPHRSTGKLAVRDDRGLLVPLTPDHPDAALIVEAVNAYEGLKGEVESLKRSKTIIVHDSPNDTLRAERDSLKSEVERLRGALEQLLAVAEVGLTRDGFIGGVIAKAREALRGGK